MIVILVVLLLVLLFWIYRRHNSGSEKFTIIRSDPQNARLEQEAYAVFDGGEPEPEKLDMNERMMKKNQALGRLNADASRGAQKSRIDYFRHIFQDELERNEEKDWWESPSSFSSKKKRDGDWED